MRLDGAELHAVHACVVTPVVPRQLSVVFRRRPWGEGRLPERVCVRKDQAADSETSVAESAPPVAEGGPLREEEPKESPVNERNGQRPVGAVARSRPKTMGWGGSTWRPWLFPAPARKQPGRHRPRDPPREGQRRSPRPTTPVRAGLVKAADRATRAWSRWLLWRSSRGVPRTWRQCHN